jgi:hypothetical protein
MKLGTLMLLLSLRLCEDTERGASAPFRNGRRQTLTISRMAGAGLLCEEWSVLLSKAEAQWGTPSRSLRRGTGISRGRLGPPVDLVLGVDNSLVPYRPGRVLRFAREVVQQVRVAL